MTLILIAIMVFDIKNDSASKEHPILVDWATPQVRWRFAVDAPWMRYPVGHAA